MWYVDSMSRKYSIPLNSVRYNVTFSTDNKPQIASGYVYIPLSEFSTGRNFVRLGVQFIRNHPKRTKI